MAERWWPLAYRIQIRMKLQRESMVQDLTGRSRRMGPLVEWMGIDLCLP